MSHPVAFRELARLEGLDMPQMNRFAVFMNLEWEIASVDTVASEPDDSAVQDSAQHVSMEVVHS